MNKLNNPSSILDLISSTNELIDKTLQKQDNITSSTNIDTLVEGIYYISSTPSNLPNGLKYLIQLGSTIQIAFDQTTGIVYHRAKVGGSFSDWYSCADYEDIPSVGNGTITITQGGVTKGTFTTNQSGNLTIDLDAGSVSGTLTNIATGSNSMVVSGATATDATGVTALGKDASIASGNNGTNGVAIGYNAKCGDSNNSGSAGVAVGKGAGVYSTNGTAVGSASMTGGAYATAIGSGADAEGNYSIQIGKGTNTESNSMYVSVGLSDSKNYKMLDTNGKIPDDRLNTTIARTSQIPTVPTKTSDLTNDSGYITGITSSDVTTALGYTPYDSSNPSGYTTNTGTVTSVNNVSPVNGNVTLSIPAAQVNSDWNATSGKAQILNKPNLATVATSGSYNDLSNKPTIPAAVTVDSALSSTSTNPVQNKVITTALNNKQGTISDLSTIRSGASAGATAVQPDDLATVATSGSYNDLSNKPTIPTVNNATLTIQKNGSTVKTFTANASSNVTANITVPTKTSELTNDSGYTSNVGTVTKVNNTSPDSSGNVSLTIPSVGNGTITITQGGTTKGSFTTNQSGNATIALDAGGGTATTVKINGTSITSSGVADIKTNGTYNASTNKIATMSDLPSAVTETTVSGWGFTKNAGTITGITMNGSSKGTSGVVDLGTVITSHQDISGKANTDLSNLTATSSTNFDGQWVPSKKVLTTTSTGTGTFAYNLRPTGTGHLDYLPDDNYVYEVLASFYQHCSSTVCTSYLSSDIIDETSTIPSGSNGRYQTVVANIPVQNTISFRRETANATGVDFRLLAYRRVGTNN